MARLYLDEDVNILLETLLRVRNITVTTTREQNMLGKSDEEQLDFATSIESAIVTHNRVHFERLFEQYIEKEIPFSGIIILIRRDVYAMATRLSKFILSNSELKNTIWYI